MSLLLKPHQTFNRNESFTLFIFPFTLALTTSYLTTSEKCVEIRSIVLNLRSTEIITYWNGWVNDGSDESYKILYLLTLVFITKTKGISIFSLIHKETCFLNPIKGTNSVHWISAIPNLNHDDDMSTCKERWDLEI